ncbi:MAG TPA: hypothetical protein VG253_17880 [Streptosporangiaceae bacterium]|jgi:hypothetical protein|nr:hypothetical protein [Streptosporangiaceae bacterium]
MKPDCQEKNLKGLTMVAVGVNKSAEQYMLLDDKTKEELATGKYHDQRRGSFGAPAPSSTGPGSPAADGPQGTARQRAASGQAPRPAAPPRQPWSTSQRKLTLLYNQQGLRPDEIAQKLGLTTYVVTQIILSARNQGKL